MGFSVRAMREEDANEVCEVHRASIFWLASGHYEREQLEYWVVSLEPEHIRVALLEMNSVGVVAEDEQGILGFAMLDGELVRAVYVHPKAARRGVGSKLLGTIEAEAKSRGVRRLHLYASVNSRCFYESQGFVFISIGEYPLWKSETMTCIEMRKHLI